MSDREQQTGPQGWKRTTLGEALPIHYGKARNEKFGTVREDTPVYGSSGRIDTFKRALTGGPSLIIGRKGTVGATYYCPEPCWPIDTVYFAEASADEDLRFFKYLLDYLQLARMGRSTAVPGLSRDDYNATEVFIPELDQQRLIVAEIEKQFSRLDEAVASLKRVKANLKRYKAAVLKAAVEGKLTEEWRLSARAASRKRAQASELETIPKAGKDKWFIYIIECDGGSYYVGHTADLHARWQAHCEGDGADWTRQHPPKYLVHFEECVSREDAVKWEQDLKTGFGRTWRKREIDAGRMKPVVHNPANETAQPVHDEDMQTGSKLLERILAERRTKWSGKGKYKEPLAPDASNLPPLPERWTWTSVDQVAEVSLGKMLDKQKHRTGRQLPYLRNINVRWGRVDTNDLLEMFFKSNELERCGLLPGDVLVCEGGEPGRAAVWDGRIPDLKYQKALHRVRFHGNTEPRYLVFVLEFLANTGRLERWFTGSTIKHFTRESFVSMPISLPPIAEQKEIIAEVERRLSVIDELEAAVEANLTRADCLRQATLQKAFSGKLLLNGART